MYFSQDRERCIGSTRTDLYRISSLAYAVVFLLTPHHRPQQAPDLSGTISGSGDDALRYVSLATMMETLTEQHESNLDKSTAERKQIVQNTCGYPVIYIHISKLNVPVGIFLIKDRDGSYTGRSSACGLLLPLATAFTEGVQPNRDTENTALK